MSEDPRGWLADFIGPAIQPRDAGGVRDLRAPVVAELDDRVHARVRFIPHEQREAVKPQTRARPRHDFLAQAAQPELLAVVAELLRRHARAAATEDVRALIALQVIGMHAKVRVVDEPDRAGLATCRRQR